ncbi:hypothetical protein CMK20_15995, partial [Candidatus Poribacteria bacterium]|nr:hypothetical protein [Candidatus Poribacteria bacterium]
NLSRLGLASNEIKMIPAGIGQLTNLTMLHLGYNQIKVIPAEIFQLTNLIELHLVSNQIEIIPVGIGQLTNLTTLHLGWNQIEVIPAESSILANLINLNLGYNQVRTFPQILNKTTNLEVLNLESNLIEFLPSMIGNLKTLHDLNLKNNNLTDIPAEINKLFKLQSLNLNQNRLQKFPTEVNKLSNLQQLYLSDNQIKFLPSTIRDLIKLERLHLDGNALGQLPIELSQLHGLMELDLSKNLIYQIPSELGSLKRLISLDLSHNCLTEIPSEILEIQQLETLNLDKNVRRDKVTDFGKVLTYQEHLEQLELIKQNAKKEIQIKKDFLSQVSHEIKTPMNGVIGSLNLIDAEQLNSEHRSHINRAKNSGQYLLTVINEILQFAEIEDGRIVYHQEPFDLVNTFRQARQILLPLSEQKKIQLNLDYPLTMCGKWLGDRQKVKQVAINLVSNAIKFTMVGQVKLVLKTTKFGIRVEIIDTGIGIPKDQTANIFESFNQASPEIGRSYGGTGLGLSISQRFVTGMGGKIGVDSKIGEGSNFWFELPLVQVNLWKEPEMEKKKSINLSNMKGLVVDDNTINRFIFRKFLENLGCQVDEAANGTECLTNYQQNQYDLILMDLQMPEANGYMVTEQIRQLEQSSGLKRVPILAISARIEEVKEQCKLAGMDGYIGKPFRSDELIEQLNQVIN